MKTRKMLALFLAAALALAVMPAAAQEEVIFPIILPEQIAEGRDVTIVVAGLPSEAQPEAREGFLAQINRFMGQYPNVTVEGLEFGYTPEAFMALVAGGQVPTLFSVFYTEPSILIPMGVAADLTPFFEQYGLTDMFNPSQLAVVTGADGGIYGIPGGGYAQGIGYNIPLLQEAGYEAPPTTFDELAEMCQALTDRDANRAGFIFWSDGSGGAGWHYTNFAFGFGADPDDLVRINEDGTYTATFGEGPAVEAMQFLRDLRWEYNCLPLALTTGDDLIPALPTGRSAMVMFPGDQLGRIRLDYPDQLADFGYAPMPAGPEGIRTLTGGSASMISAAASADEQEAAFVFQIWRQMNTNPEELIAGFELQNETQGAVGIPFLKIYAGEYQDALAALQEPYVVMPVENYAAFNDAIDSGEVTLVPEPPRAQEYYVAVGAVLSQVLTDENADVAALMAQAADEFQAGVLDLLDPAPTAQ